MTYGTILADPPWVFDNWSERGEALRELAAVGDDGKQFGLHEGAERLWR